MKQLEDQLKNAFDHFEPEVDPSVWANVSSQISAPLAPANDGGSSIASAVSKGVLSKFGPVAGWISAAAVVITGAVLAWKLTSKPVENVNVPVKETPVKVEESSTQQITIPVDIKKEEKTISSSVNSSKQDQSVNGDQQKNQLNSSTAASVQNTTENITSERNPVSPKSSETSNPKNADVPETRNAAGSTSVDNPSANNNTVTSSGASASKAAKPVLILNTKGGFAPLSVTIITNQESKSADFDFGDGTVLTQSESATHKFEEPGIYTIRCKVADTELESSVEVLGKIGSAFSPNGDGINDLFIISDPQVSTVEISIFDRTGKKIFASKGHEIRWDGKISGDRFAETGTYFYNIFVTSQNGSSYKQKGTINLFK